MCGRIFLSFAALLEVCLSSRRVFSPGFLGFYFPFSPGLFWIPLFLDDCVPLFLLGCVHLSRIFLLQGEHVFLRFSFVRKLILSFVRKLIRFRV